MPWLTRESRRVPEEAVARTECAVYAHAMSAERIATRKRSLVKALTYRVIIVILDFLVVYVLTKKTEVAVGFMIISNLYTSVGYFVHERLWARITWGLGTASETPLKSTAQTG